MRVLLTLIDPLDLFIETNGEWLYFFLIMATSLASLFMVFGQRLRRPKDLAVRRYVWALFGVVIVWITLMAGSLMALALDQDSSQVLPPLERFSSVATILFILWAFWAADREHRRKSPDLFLGFGIIAVIAGYVASAFMWHDLAGTMDFNLSDLGVTWAFIAVVLSTVGFGLILADFKTVVDAPLKLMFFIILLLGFGTTLVQIGQGRIVGDYSGPTRLAFVSALGIAAIVVYRTVITSLASESPDENKELVQEKTHTRPESRDPISVKPTGIAQNAEKLLDALEIVLMDGGGNNRSEKIVKAVIAALKADVCVLLTPNGANYVEVNTGYNQALKRELQSVTIRLDSHPTLVASLERHNQYPLLPDRNMAEIRDLFTHFDIMETGPAYFQPLVYGNVLVAVLVVAMPYSKRELHVSEEETLRKIAELVSGVFMWNRGTEAGPTDTAQVPILSVDEEAALPTDVAGSNEKVVSRQSLQQSLRLAREQISQLSAQIVGLKAKLNKESNRFATELGDSQIELTVSQQMLALTDEHYRLREERDTLSNQVQEAETVLHGALATSDEALLEEMIVSLQREKSNLTGERDRLQRQLDDVLAQDNNTEDSVQAMIDRMAEEKARLTEERDQLSMKLTEIQAQLESAGIEMGSAGLVQFIQQLAEQRVTLQDQNTALRAEYGRLLEERVGLADQIKGEKDRESRIRLLERELESLATGREAAVKQRDKAQVEFSELQNKLDLIKEHRTRLLAQTSAYEEERREVHIIQTRMKSELRNLINERSDLVSERDRLIAEKHALVTERGQLLARIDGDRERIEEVGTNGIGSLASMVGDLTEQRSQLEHELSETRSSLETAEYNIDELRIRLQEDEGNRQKQPNSPDLIVGLVQELRTPMTSITGYVDLLLGESAGILGEMQRKFLQRVSTNISRLAAMLNDLIHITELDTGKIVFEPVPVNITNIIEDAITRASNQFREKELTINLNIESNLPSVNIDRDAIEQVIGQLLSNAYLVSPPNTEISVNAQQRDIVLSNLSESEAAVECLYVSIEDCGGGIHKEDEERVFARKYKAENPLITGLGDTGVGMAIAKSLIDAQGGNLWVEAKEDVGSMFAFVLPLVPTSETGE
jgi:signal transduction histidine kinase